MSFNFTWPDFSSSFIADAAAMLDSALNKGVKPKVIADDIKVEDIHMGSIPPELEILEIGELSTDRFRGIFRLTYTGDAHLTLSTKVQANPLSRPTASSSSSVFEDASSVFPSSMPSRGILFAARPLIVPMKLHLSSVRLKAIVVLVVSKQKGITLVFKNDPLESVDVSSTFDSVAVIQKYLQQEIEGQLREMFREDLPGIIHRLSQKWLSGNREGQQKKQQQQPNHTSTPGKNNATKATSPRAGTSHSSSSPAKAKTGLASLNSSPEKKFQQPLPKTNRTTSESVLSPSLMNKSPSRRRKSDKFTAELTPSSPRTTHRGSKIISTSPRNTTTKAKSALEMSSSGFSEERADLSSSTSFGLDRGWKSGLMDDMEGYDPTYGLRPDDVRTAIQGGGYSGLARLAGQVNGGLRDLTISDTSRAISQDRTNEGRTIKAMPTHDTDSEEDDRQVSADLMNEAIGHSPQKQRDRSDVLLSSDDEGALDDEDNDDDVPDRPHSDEESDRILDDDDDDNDDDDDDDEIDHDDSAADFTMYGYPPPGAAFSDTAVENNARQSTSVFDFDSSFNESPRPLLRAVRSLSTHSSGRPTSIISPTTRTRKNNKVEYETLPAVGGGMITRPRIYHTASQVRAPEVDDDDDDLEEYLVGGSAAASSTARGPTSSQTYTIRPSKSYQDDLSGFPVEDGMREQDGLLEDSPSALGHESIVTLEPEPMDPSTTAYRTQLYRHQYGGLYRAGYNRQSSMSSALSFDDASKSVKDRQAVYHRSGDSKMQLGLSSNSRSSTAPTSVYPSTNTDYSQGKDGQMPSSPSSGHIRSRDRKSGVSVYPLQSSPPAPQRYNNNTLLPPPSQSMTMGASQHFMDLVNSNHTLSPFTRTLDTKGFAVRSHPVTPSTGSGGETSSSNMSGMVSRPLTSSSLASWKSNANSANYFDRSRTISETGRGKRRTFKMGGKVSSNDSNEVAQINDRQMRPDSSPIQQSRGSFTQASRGPALAGGRFAARNDGPKHSMGSVPTQSRRRSRQLAQSDRAILTMGAIRE
ncbi:hypothetical protein CBS101457_006227 [Exobasidium rhododendri]|nr:hypothetical protein CBS101457_006227 [Exobasidium rhododendri]